MDVQDEKLQKAKTLGATYTINARNEDAAKKIKVVDPFLVYLIWRYEQFLIIGLLKQ